MAHLIPRWPLNSARLCYICSGKHHLKKMVREGWQVSICDLWEGPTGRCQSRWGEAWWGGPQTLPAPLSVGRAALLHFTVGESLTRGASAEWSLNTCQELSLVLKSSPVLVPLGSA